MNTEGCFGRGGILLVPSYYLAGCPFRAVQANEHNAKYCAARQCMYGSYVSADRYPETILFRRRQRGDDRVPQERQGYGGFFRPGVD